MATKKKDAKIGFSLSDEVLAEGERVPTPAETNELTVVLVKFENALAEFIAKAVMANKVPVMSLNGDYIADAVKAVCDRVSKGFVPGRVKTTVIGYEAEVKATFSLDGLISAYGRLKNKELVAHHIKTVMSAVRDALFPYAKSKAEELALRFYVGAAIEILLGRPVSFETIIKNIEEPTHAYTRAILNAFGSAFGPDAGEARLKVVGFSDEIIKVVSEAVAPLLQRMWDSVFSVGGKPE